MSAARIWRLLLCAALLVGPAGAQTGPAAIDVDLALVLVVDTSESVSEKDYQLQRTGLASAFANQEIIDAITNGALGRIAVSVIEFSSAADVRIPLTVLDSKQGALSFAAAIQALERDDGDLRSMTSISAGISLAVSLIEAAPVRATRRVIDVSGDGPNNQDAVDVNMDMVRMRATTAKIVINGLAIIDEDPSTEEFYREWVVLGRGGFLIPAVNSRSFGEAMRRKLIREIS